MCWRLRALITVPNALADSFYLEGVQLKQEGMVDMVCDCVMHNYLSRNISIALEAPSLSY